MSDDGDGAVAHGDHLNKPTGFEFGRHDEKVTSGVNAAGELGVKFDVGGEMGVGFCRLAELVLKLRIAGAQENELVVVVGKAAGADGFEDEVNAFLDGVKTTDESKKRCVSVFGKAGLFLKGGFIGLFS